MYNVEAVIQIFLCLLMSCFDSQLVNDSFTAPWWLYPYRGFFLLTSYNKPLSVFCLGIDITQKAFFMNANVEIVPTVLLSHQIVNNWSKSQCWVCVSTPHFALQYQKDHKILCTLTRLYMLIKRKSNFPALYLGTNWFKQTWLSYPPHHSFII